MKQNYREFWKLASKIMHFSTIYVGNLEREGTHITIEGDSWAVEKIKEVMANPACIDSALESARKLYALGVYQHKSPTLTVLEDRFRHNKPVFGQIILKESNLAHVNELFGKLTWLNRYIMLEPVSQKEFHSDLLKQGVSSKQRQPQADLLIETDEVEKINFLQREDLIRSSRDNHVNVIITPQKYEELEKIVSTEFGQKLGDIQTIQINRNTTSYLYLANGEQSLLKEFPNGTKGKLALDYYFSDLLSRENLAPRVKMGESMLFIASLGKLSLKDIDLNDPKLAAYYDKAIDVLIALGDLDGRKDCNIRNLHVPVIGKQYYEEKVGAAPEISGSAIVTLINTDFYPGHLMVDEKSDLVRGIDWESVSYGPIELALASLLINTFHDLSHEFIMERLNYYCSRKKGISQKTLYESFNAHAAWQNKRLECMLERIKRKTSSDDVLVAEKKIAGREPAYGKLISL
jgi:hypothetical protein